MERPLPASDALFDEAADLISGRNLPVFKTGFVNCVSGVLWGAKVDINTNCEKSFLIYKFTFSTQDFSSNITNFMVTW